MSGLSEVGLQSGGILKAKLKPQCVCTGPHARLGFNFSFIIIAEIMYI